MSEERRAELERQYSHAKRAKQEHGDRLLLGAYDKSELRRRFAFPISQEQLASKLGYRGAKVIEMRSEDFGNKLGIQVEFPEDHPVSKGEITATEWGKRRR